MSDEQTQTERLAAWAAEHGLEMAKVQAPPALDISKIFVVDEQNFAPQALYDVFYPLTPGIRVGNKSKLSILITRLKWKLEALQYEYYEFMFKARNKWKLPENMCCWKDNHCLDKYCPKCDYQLSACANCDWVDPCPECKD
jgi:hypothetical protein